MHLEGFDLALAIHTTAETSIWRGTRTADGTSVIVKCATSGTPPPSVAARLQHEVRTLERLRGVPGVVPLLEARQTPRGAAIVMSDEGLTPLADLVARGPLPLALALRVGAGLARALAELHRRDVLHKDVKPANVLVSSDGATVELIDFGIASWLGRESARGGVEGTLAYMAPEQTGRTGRAVDARADLYALGVTLFELLAGHRPFAVEDPVALMHAHLAVAPTPLDALGAAPTAVARIVSRLLAKDPERRYQTAAGVAADLERAAELARHGVAIEPFALGARDFVLGVRLPEALVGRAAEELALRKAYARARAGGREVVLLAGPSGSGKTVLARTVRTLAARDGGAVFLAGKHEALSRSRPYAALAEAFGARCAEAAAAPAEVVARFGRRLRDGLGPNASLLADVMGELTWVTGPLAPAAELGPQEHQRRLALAWVNLASAVRDEAGGGLVLFVDDAQWADPATLGLLGDLASDAPGVLTIVSFRSDEVGPEHPLWSAVERASASGAEVTRVDVGDLDLERVGELVMAALPGLERSGESAELAALVARRTGGNPFFVGQLLLALAARGHLARDPETGAWRWDVDAVARAPLGDDVVALVTTRLRELPADTQHALGVAACAGARFDVAELGDLVGGTASAAARVLWPALQMGVVVDEVGRFRAALDEALDASGHPELWLRFAHDRVQEAAWSRLDAAARAETHRRLARRFGDGPLDGAARFERARHAIEALPVTADPTERATVVAHARDAALAARRAGAFDAMQRFVDGATAALAGAAPDPEAEVAVAVLRVQCDVLARRFEAAEAHAVALLATPLPRSVRLGLYGLRLQVAVSTGALTRGTEIAREGQAENGIVTPEDAALVPALMARLGAVMATDLGAIEANPAAWFSSPYDEIEAASDVLTFYGGLCAATGGAPLVGAYWLALAVGEMLAKRRATPVSPFFLVGLGQVLSTTTADPRMPVRWVKLGAALADQLRAPVQADCAVQAAHLTPYDATVEATVAAYERAVALGFEQGTFQAISWGTMGALTYGHAWRGEAIATLRERIARAAMTVERAGDIPGRDLVEYLLAWLDVLQGAAGGAGAAASEARERPPLDLATDDLLAVGPRTLRARGNGNGAAIARVYECHARWVHGYRAETLALAEEAEAERASMFALVTGTDVDFWLGLGSSHAADTCAGEARAARVAMVARSRDRFRVLVEGSVANFEHKLLVLEAELARLDGRGLDALALFDRAAASAERHGFVFIRGVALERAGELARALGLDAGARGYLAAAREQYLALGADAVAAALGRRHGLDVARPAPRSSRTSSATHTTTTVAATTRLASDDFDLGTVLRAADTLGAERDPAGVVARLMAMVVASAGAERGVLVLAHADGPADADAGRAADPGEGDAGWEIAARHGSAARDVGARARLDAVSGAVPAALRYVARTRQRLVVPDASREPRFASDARVASGEAASFVAAPLLHRGELVGVLYLEHSAPGAFAASRAALLEMLAGLGAVAWENARLVSGLQAARDALAEANAGLERQVAARTAALDKALAELWTEMDLATRIQTVLLPEDGRYGLYDVAAVMRPAERVGGDYYDVFEHAGHLWVLIGDVSGHGVNAGLVMMMVQASVRAVVRALDGATPLSPARLLVTVNAALRYGLGRLGRGQYMTITALRLDAEGAVHAGLHQDLVVRRGATREVALVPTDGLWLGVLDDVDGIMVDTPLPLGPGDSVVLYTDGVTETRSRGAAPLGVEPMVAAVARAGDAAPAEVVAAVLALLDGHEVDDDVTVVCLARR